MGDDQVETMPAAPPRLVQAVSSEELFAETLDTTDRLQLLRFALRLQGAVTRGPFMPVDATEAVAQYRGVGEWLHAVEQSVHVAVTRHRVDQTRQHALDWLTAYAAASVKEREVMATWMDRSSDTELQVMVLPVRTAIDASSGGAA